jgi:hypothetical protein
MIAVCVVVMRMFYKSELELCLEEVMLSQKVGMKFNI